MYLIYFNMLLASYYLVFFLLLAIQTVQWQNFHLNKQEHQ